LTNQLKVGSSFSLHDRLRMVGISLAIHDTIITQEHEDDRQFSQASEGRR
jgi:hypothetical protein